jgi:SAM-dependent methyltransferase
MPTTKWIKESAFGIWFLNTYTWRERVLRIALNDLQQLIPKQPIQPLILDVGCGRGNAFQLLAEQFQPKLIAGIEIDIELLPDTLRVAERCTCPVLVLAGNIEVLPLEEHSVDVVFCHQSFHHIIQHRQAMLEFHRVLKPGGLLLFAESCKRFIHSLPIRLLFRHPMTVQKTAEQYIQLIRSSGFDLDDSQISMPYLWWSRPDIGALEWLGWSLPVPQEATLVNLVAIKL